MKNAFWTRPARLAAAVALTALTVGCELEDGAAGEVRPRDKSAGADAGPVAQAEATPAEPAAETPSAAPAEPVADPGASAEAGAPAPVREPWTLEHAGFAAHLPPDTDFYVDARELGWVGALIERLGLGESIAKLMASPQAHELESWAARELGHALFAEAREVVPMLLKEEAFLAGRGLTLVGEAAVEVNAATNRSFGVEMVKAIVSGEFFMVADDEIGASVPSETAKWLLRNAPRVEADPALALYLGGRVAGGAGGEAAERIARQIAQLAEEIEVVKPASWESGGVEWSGAEVTLGELGGFGDAEAPDSIEEEDWKKLIDTVGEWKVALGCAMLGDFAVIALGLGREAIELAARPEESLAANEAAAFFERFDAHSIYGTAWASEALVENAMAWYLDQSVVAGVEEEVKQSPGLRLGPAMAGAMQEFNEHLMAMTEGRAFPYVAAAVVGDDLRIESRGGWKGSGLDLGSPLKFGKVFEAMGDKLFLRAHWKLGERYRVLGKRLAMAGKGFVRLAAEEAMEFAQSRAEEEGDDELLPKLTRWKRDLLKGIDDIWEGYDRHFSHALGAEAAFAMDLDGKMVPAVGVDEAVLERGRIPRAAYVRPVVKREALSESWIVWQQAATNLFGIMAEVADRPIPFPDTMTAEKDELRTSFFSFPFASDDFLPSVSVSDELFILGSSKTLSESLYDATIEGPDGEARPGLHVEMNAAPLWDFCAAWLDVYEARQEAAEEIEEDELRLEDEEAEADGPAFEGEAQAGPVEEVVPPEDPDSPAGERDESIEPLGAEQPAQPEPALTLERLQLPQEKVENPFLKQLMEPEEGGAPAIEDRPEFHPHQIEVDAIVDVEALADEFADDEFEEDGLIWPDAMGELLPDLETLRAVLDKARQFRGITYRRWLEDDVPRATLRVEGAAP